MSKTSARCPLCGEILEIDGSKEAIICSYCGNPIVTKTAIENLKSVASNGDIPAELATLINNYNAFVQLYDVDFDAALEPLRLNAAKLRAQKELAELVEQYEAAVKKADKSLNKANSRVDAYNDAKFTVGVDSWFEKKASEWVDKGKKKYEDAVSNANDLERQIKSKKSAISGYEKEAADVERALYNNGATLYYNGQALATAETMCNKFPSHPAGYIYKADFYRREMLWRTKMVETAVDQYRTDLEMLTILGEADVQYKKTDLISAEIKKAETFIKSTNNAELKKMLADLKKFVGNAGSYAASTNQTPTVSKTSSSASKDRSESLTEEIARLRDSDGKQEAKSETVEEKIARLQEEKRLDDEETKKIQRQMKRRSRFIKFIVCVVIIVVAGVAAYIWVRSKL